MNQFTLAASLKTMVAASMGSADVKYDGLKGRNGRKFMLIHEIINLAKEG